jgi:hypothetical protein
MATIEDLNRIKSRLEAAKTKRANIEGKISSKKEQLIAMGFVDSDSIVEDAEKELKKLDIQLNTMAEEFDSRMEKFVKDFPSLFAE